ncbi:MAG: phosphatidate cytidylyltransferase [Acidimicrobiia bacterium]|nr:phosphatidate cytidylyltransferase [bacterium]MXZ06830.1 phosphatidate cytidylyltransferase [Acidimicrobiia bacterium]MCY3580922.1 phosphatidate cytidylyltransferase [bacterium]MCY3652108.1 phosphatidate cytidylyltransferase [bacterium]MDE0642919.1 phosphatidate cytidylyltransferase [bacterium]
MAGDGPERPEEKVDTEADDQPVDPGEPTSETDEFTDRDYIKSTTREYQGLAESVAKAGEEDVEQSAVAASIPGVGTGVVGFEDVTGEEEEDPQQIEEIDRARRSELAFRILTGLVAVAVFFGVLSAGAGWVTLLVGVILVVALGEFYQVTRQVGYTPLAFIGLPGAGAVFYMVWNNGPTSVGGVLAAVILLSGLFYAAVDRGYPLANIGVTVLGVAWVPVLASFAIPIFQSPQAWGLTTALVVLTALNDIAGFTYGRALGKRLMAPVLSPNKTLEGFLGATVFTLLAGFVIGWFELLEPFDMVSGLALAGVISVFGPIGDLAQSAVKRSIGIKDMGSSLPGHGGVLDRLDAFLFTIPGAYLLYLWLGYL